MTERRRRPGRPPRARAPLSRDAVLQAALAVVDREGLAGLSMRSLAAALGVTPMALYHHVDGKRGLLDLVNEAVWLGVAWPAGGPAPWRDALAATARAIRQTLRAHPNTAPLVAARPARAPALLTALDALLGRLAQAGFGPKEALYAVDAIGIFTVGHAQAEFGRSPTGEEADGADDLRLTGAGGLGRTWPHLAAAAAGRHDYDAEFEFGLAALLEGLAPTRRHRPGRR